MKPTSALVLVVLAVACGGTVETPAPCATDAGLTVDAVADTTTDTTNPDTGTVCVLLCDSDVGWFCGGRVLGCFDAGSPCCDPQRPTCGCFPNVGYLCGGALADDATSCAACGLRCNSTDGGTTD